MALYLASRVRIGGTTKAPNNITILGYELKEADKTFCFVKIFFFFILIIVVIVRQ